MIGIGLIVTVSLFLLFSTQNLVKDSKSIQYVRVEYQGEALVIPDKDVDAWRVLLSSLQYRTMPTYVNPVQVGEIEIRFMADGKPNHLVLGEQNYCYQDPNHLYTLRDGEAIYQKVLKLLT